MSQGFNSMDDPGAYLKHYGVKGQRWGVRNWQNADGTVTAAGRIHYGYKGIREGGTEKLGYDLSNANLSEGSRSSKYINDDDSLTMFGKKKYGYGNKPDQDAIPSSVTAAINKANKNEEYVDTVNADTYTLKGKIEHLASLATLGAGGAIIAATPVPIAVKATYGVAAVGIGAYLTALRPMIANHKDITATKMADLVRNSGYDVEEVPVTAQRSNEKNESYDPIKGKRYKIDTTKTPENDSFDTKLNTKKQKQAAATLNAYLSNGTLDKNSNAYKVALSLIQRNANPKKVKQYLQDALDIDEEDEY